MVDAVVRLTKQPNQSNVDYLTTISFSRTASLVKLSDLLDNLNLDRILNPQEKDYARQEKYVKSYKALMSFFSRESDDYKKFAKLFAEKYPQFNLYD